ncbi:hypothetical protein ACHQM5_005841 [Ranunculus cassubicifolius]
MISSLSTPNPPNTLQPHNNPFSFLNSSPPFLNFRIPRKSTFKLSTTSAIEKKIQLSWVNPDTGDYNGWGIVETEQRVTKKKGFLSYFVIGASVSTLFLVAASLLARKGYMFNLNTMPWNPLSRLEAPSEESSELAMADENIVDVSEGTSELLEENVEINVSEPAELPKRVILTVAADSTQQEALQLMKKLEIIDNDVKADALCTRREFARWLVKTNISFERNPKHRITIPPKSVVQAFDDVENADQDFHFIQALAEVGIVGSKLSDKNNSSDLDDPKVEGGFYFYPESPISRLDLINWKAQLEYLDTSRIQQISTKNNGFMDVSAIDLEASSGFLMDTMAGDKSILRKVFGQSRRFQPHKPVTNAQVAVTLTSGRMTDAIRTELSRLEMENSSMLAEMEEIRSELLLRGEIPKFWEERIDQMKAYGQEVKKNYDAAVSVLEQEKILRAQSLSDNLKERATLDCQRKLISNIEEEVHEMSGRLISERADFVVEKKDLEKMSSELRAKLDGMTEAKSILEAEKEALRMLRSWIEDEARKSQARAQVLEKVGRRWKWNEES